MIVDCLESMRLDKPSADDDATADDNATAWIDCVNHGGVFQINDATYEFFVQLETIVRTELRQYLFSKDDSKDKFRIRVVTDDKVRDSWYRLSQDVDDESVASDLLNDIVTQSITMRRYSLTSALMKEYKVEKGRWAKKSKGFRKSLSKSYIT